MIRLIPNAASLCLLAILAGCGSSPTSRPSQSGEPALKVMERVALSARDCWFRGKDPAFASYSLAPELDSHSGRPRILVVPKRNPGGLPLLVVEGQGTPARIQTFGPLLDGPEGKRVMADVNRWQGGDRSCARV